jgi:hypothetical protein
MRLQNKGMTKKRVKKKKKRRRRRRRRKRRRRRRKDYKTMRSSFQKEHMIKEELDRKELRVAYKGCMKKSFSIK